MYGENAWNKYDSYEEIMEFNEGYKDFISTCKTERICVTESVKLAEAKGYVNFETYVKNNKALTKGDKIYVVNKNKNLILFIIGEKPLSEGMRILGAHIDSPRLDVKQNPIYEKDNLVLLDTHYYGGIKKYQWVTLPLSICGVVIKKDGTKIDVMIGEKDSDPVVGITDLLPHLGATQQKKVGAKVVEGEDLDVMIGSIPQKDEEKDSVKKYILKLLEETYNIEEEDFLSAELEIVPSGKARDFGIDRSMVMSYGQDDRVCAYTSLLAILDSEPCTYTSCCFLVDKEEIGSVGASGAQSTFFENTIAEMLHLNGDDSFLSVRKAMENSYMLSSDVSAAVDPLYEKVSEKKNAAFLGYGISFNKYTGSRGKSGSNDANPEFIAKIRNILDKENIHYQFSELGKVDEGGGGTIAYMFGNHNMNVIDAGIAVLSMHSPWEVTSKVDNYEAYLAYKIFLKDLD